MVLANAAAAPLKPAAAFEPVLPVCAPRHSSRAVAAGAGPVERFRTGFSSCRAPARIDQPTPAIVARRHRCCRHRSDCRKQPGPLERSHPPRATAAVRAVRVAAHSYLTPDAEAAALLPFHAPLA